MRSPLTTPWPPLHDVLQDASLTNTCPPYTTCSTKHCSTHHWSNAYPPSVGTPFHKPTFSTKISSSKDSALELAQNTHWTTKYKVYCDGSSIEGGVGAATILYKNNRVLKTRRAYLGSAKEHTVFEAKLVGVLLALSLLYNLTCQLTTLVIIGLDNQAVLCALNNQDTKLSHYLLDHIHTAVEKLHQKQDQAQNLADFCNTWQAGNHLIAKTCGIVNIRLQWVPGHIDFAPNEKADAEAKWATRGQSNANALLPKSLHKSLPHSVSALWQYQKAKVQKRWLRQWKASPRYVKQWHINDTTSSKKWLQLVVTPT